MRNAPRPRKPLDSAAMERMALRYVERYATTRAKLRDYLKRKLRERGWEGSEPDPVALADRMAELGYVNDRAFAEARISAMTRRGLGARRVTMALRHAGVQAEDAEAIEPDILDQAASAALAFAKRKRLGPFAVAVPERDVREKQFAAMLRAGHSPALAKKILAMQPGDDGEALLIAD